MVVPESNIYTMLVGFDRNHGMIFYDYLFIDMGNVHLSKVVDSCLFYTYNYPSFTCKTTPFYTLKNHVFSLLQVYFFCGLMDNFCLVGYIASDRSEEAEAVAGWQGR